MSGMALVVCIGGPARVRGGSIAPPEKISRGQ